MQRTPIPMLDQIARLKKVMTLSDYLGSPKRLTPSELRTLATAVRRNAHDSSGPAERIALAIESVAATRAESNSSAMRRDAPATTLLERLSDWATASF